MFGCICAGRQVQTNLQAISETEFLFSLPSAQHVNHIVVFILPTTQLPPEYVATVWFQWPGKPFRLLGGLSTEKQSAIFRLKGSGSIPSTALEPQTSSMDDMNDDDVSGEHFADNREDITAQLGISIEPVAQAQEKLSSLSSQSSTINIQSVSTSLVPQGASAATSDAHSVHMVVSLARRITQDALNYLGSFSSGPPGGETIPIKELQNWCNRFERKVATDAHFLEKQTSGA